MIIRKIKLEDAKNFQKMLFKLDSETNYMLYEDGERKENIKGIENMIESSLEGENLTLVVEDKGETVGFLGCKRGELNRIKHSGYIVVGIRSKYRGVGIGTKLFKELDTWAVSKGLKRLELTVVSENLGGVNLYKNSGFIIEGIKKNSMIINGEYKDEYYMGKVYE